MKDRYGDHASPAIRLLYKILPSFPPRSLARDIIASSILYLEGDSRPSGLVAKWWKQSI